MILKYSFSKVKNYKQNITFVLSFQASTQFQNKLKATVNSIRDIFQVIKKIKNFIKIFYHDFRLLNDYFNLIISVNKFTIKIKILIC